MGTIQNAANVSVSVQTGSIPNLGTAMLDWFQYLTFEQIVKTTTAFQVVETTVPINFWGLIQPFTERQLQFLPEGQRAWTWLLMHAQPQLELNVDDVCLFLGVQTRVMTRRNYTLYGYSEFRLCQDWLGSGPEGGL